MKVVVHVNRSGINFKYRNTVIHYEPKHHPGKEMVVKALHSFKEILTRYYGNVEETQKLWDKLGDVPINENEEIEENFLHFLAGTDREDIWHWFEEKFDLNVAVDLMKVGR